METKRVSFPHMGNYFTAFKPIVELLGDEVITPPPITKKTIELGFKHSPENVCIPFKYNLGNYIEALDKGANVLIQAGGGCRFGYYGEIQEEILKKMGYKFSFLKLANQYNPLAIAKSFKTYNPKLTHIRIFKGFILSYSRLRCLDEIESFIRLNIGFEKKEGEFEKTHKQFLNELGQTKSISDVKNLKKKYLNKFHSIEIDKPSNPIRVGVIGELYVVMEPFSNFNLEKELAKKKIEVHRFVTVSNILHEDFSMGRYITKAIKHAHPYLKHHIGAHGTESVGIMHQLVKDGFDGVIHIKPFGCMPEVNAMSALHKISKDYKFPVIYFSFDSLTSETGIKTRLEAFYDMLIMKKKINN